MVVEGGIPAAALLNNKKRHWVYLSGFEDIVLEVRRVGFLDFKNVEAYLMIFGDIYVTWII